MNLPALARRARLVSLPALLGVAVAGCASFDRRPWVGSWGEGSDFSTASIALASNGTGLISAGGMFFVPIRWRVNGKMAEIVPAKFDGLPPEELDALKAHARLIEGGRFIELTPVGRGGCLRRLPLISHDDSIAEVEKWTRELQAALKGEPDGPRSADEPLRMDPSVAVEHFNTRAELVAAMEGRLKRETGAVTLTVCESDGWEFIRLSRQFDQLSLRYVMARGGHRLGTPFTAVSFPRQTLPQTTTPLTPLYGERITVLIDDAIRESSAKMSAQYVTWLGADGYAEEQATIMWPVKANADSAWKRIMTELVPAGPIDLRLVTDVEWRDQPSGARRLN